MTTEYLYIAQELAAQIQPRAAEADRTATLPPEDVRALTASGYSILSVPKKYGGYGASLAECVEAQMHLAQGSTSTALVAAMQLQVLGNQAEQRDWPAERFAFLCDQAVNHSGLFNLCASEPALGSPSRGQIFATTAIRDADSYIVNGHKNWVTGGRHLTHHLTYADLSGSPIILLIPADLPGIHWKETWKQAIALRATDSHDVIYENVRVPVDNLLVAPDAPATRPNVWFFMMLAGTYLGAAIAACNALITYTHQRVPTSLGKPIATLPKIHRQVGAIDVKLKAARALLLDSARQWQGNTNWETHYPHLVAAKVFALDVANEVTQQALEIAGAASISGHTLSLERHFRDVRAGLMQPPSGDTALEIVGKAAIGLE